MHRSHRILAIALSIAVFAPFGTAVAVDRGHTAEVTKRTSARIYGCTAEDTCKIDYRSSGVWVITRVTP